MFEVFFLYIYLKVYMYVLAISLLNIFRLLFEKMEYFFIFKIALYLALLKACSRLVLLYPYLVFYILII